MPKVQMTAQQALQFLKDVNKPGFDVKKELKKFEAPQGVDVPANIELPTQDEMDELLTKYTVGIIGPRPKPMSYSC